MRNLLTTRSDLARGQRSDDLENGELMVYGSFSVGGAGEARHKVAFGVRFLGEPIVTFGFRLHGDLANAGAPKPYALIVDFLGVDRSDAMGSHVVGMDLYARIDGAEGLSMTVNWMAFGRGLRT